MARPGRRVRAARREPARAARHERTRGERSGQGSPCPRDCDAPRRGGLLLLERGEDSALALREATTRGLEARLLLTMMTETGRRSRSHGLSREVLSAQAGLIGLPILFRATSWDDYEGEFRAAVSMAVSLGAGIGIFGDIDIEAHRQWVESQCTMSGATAVLPRWRRDRASLVHDLLDAGFDARIVAVRDGALPPALLGRALDDDVLDHLDRVGADLAGENGEYHTVVTDGPIFSRPLWLTFGESTLRDGVWFVDAVVR
ncbi:MAG: adenosine nucleotide hydrolase [Acidimicrobiales bacterium]